MGIDYYVCDECGEGFNDAGEHVFCECGAHYCSYECAANAEYHDHSDDEEDDDDIPDRVLDEDGFEQETSCMYCRGEKLTDEQVLEWLKNQADK